MYETGLSILSEYLKSVSVVIVNWNGKKFIAECLDGLRKQTYKDHSIVLVDNAETFARLWLTFDFSVMTINFQNSGTSECLLPRIKTSLRQMRKKPNSNVPLTEALCPDFGSRAHLSFTQEEVQGFWLPSSD